MTPAASPSSRRRDAWTAAPLALACLLHLSLAAASWRIGPGMNSDSATGFLLWDAWRSRHPWNHQPFPDPADIARDTSVFQAWWSPGQYLAVAPLQLLGLSLGQAIALGSLGWTLAGLAGWHRLFLRFAFPPRLAAWSVLLLACNWTLVRSYGDYMGGELALLALSPWLLLALWRAGRSAGPGLLAAPFWIWLGAMAKNTFLPFAAGALLAARWPALFGNARGRRLASLAGVGAALAAGHGLFWLTFLRHGWYPGSGGAGSFSPDAGLNLVRLAGFPLGGLFSLQNLLGRLFFYPAHPLAAGWPSLWPLLAPLGLGLLAATLWIVRRELRERPDYGRLLAATLFCACAAFGLFALTRDAGGLEERFLRPCSFLLAPAALSALVSLRGAALRAALALPLLLGSAYGAAGGLLRARHLGALDSRGERGVSQTAIHGAALSELRRLDREAPPGALVVVSSPEMAFELTRSRHWATHLEMMPAEAVAPAPLRGRVPCVIVVSGPGARADGRDRRLLSRFADLDSAAWRETLVGDWRFFRNDSPAP